METGGSRKGNLEKEEGGTRCFFGKLSLSICGKWVGDSTSLMTLLSTLLCMAGHVSCFKKCYLGGEKRTLPQRNASALSSQWKFGPMPSVELDRGEGLRRGCV